MKSVKALLSAPEEVQKLINMKDHQTKSNASWLRAEEQGPVAAGPVLHLPSVGLEDQTLKVTSPGLDQVNWT